MSSILESKHLKTKDIGDAGEEKAMLFLKEKGYEILAQNYRYKRYEIDIIAKYDDTIIFVEVKQRKNNRFGFPEEFIDEAKIDRIMQAASFYCEKHNWEKAIRLDAIAISGKQSIEHFKDIS